MTSGFPWEPFPPGTPGPGGKDPLLATIYRAAVEGADAYRAVRAAVREEGGALRVGNRFLPEGRYREVGFVALGHAAGSMALAALHVFGERVTQGFVAGPEEPPASIPFRWVTVGDGWGGAPEVPQVVDAAREIAGSLRANDLFLLLLSPGAIRALLEPPPGLAPAAFAAGLQQLYGAGASGAEVGSVARVLGRGGVGGRLLPAAVAAEVQCLVVERGDGAVAVGGGPLFPVRETERVTVEEVLERTGLGGALPRSDAGELPTARPGPRPVVIAGPDDALRAAADAVVEKGWTARIGELRLPGRPAAAAARFLERAEAVYTAERPGAEADSKGVVVFAPTTLDVPEGVDARAACDAFLAELPHVVRRRETTVGLLRSAGALGSPPSFGGGVVGPPGDRSAPALPGVRSLGMRAGITEVGELAVALFPTSESRRDGARPG